MSSQDSGDLNGAIAAAGSLKIFDLLCCPGCQATLEWRATATGLSCHTCKREYPVTDGIPRLFAPNEWPDDKPDVTEIVKRFYEETPFPNYDDLDSRESLQEKAQRSVFARLLDEQLPRPATILEAGCGTGQLTNFLGSKWGRLVIGGDVCLNSLRLGKAFRDRCAIANVTFAQMNLFRPPFPNETFDVVMCNGVLHHTSDPAGGFRSLAGKLKPGGYIIIGLYNSLGRLPILWRRAMIRSFGDKFAALDRRLRGRSLNPSRWAAWFHDQYRHPHESRHSIDEVLGWFDRENVQFLSSVPCIGDVDFTGDFHLFDRHPKGRRLDRLSTELGMLLSGGKDGGHVHHDRPETRCLTSCWSEVCWPACRPLHSPSHPLWLSSMDNDRTLSPGQNPRQLKVVYLLGWFLLIASGISFGSILSEAGYRCWLYFKDPAKFFRRTDEEKHPSVFFFQHSVWQFNEEFGYTYIPNSRWQSGFIQHGTLAGCDGTAFTNEFGNMGIIRHPYGEAQVKVLLFGDSVTMQPRENRTYANFLEEILEAKLGKTVSVMNFGRDGYGVLQMFDLARRKVPEFKPDLVMFSPITDDFTRGRSWRTVNVIDGRKRLLTTIEPKEQADLAISTDTLIVDERASQAWCDTFAKERRLGDPLVAELEEAYREAQRHNLGRPSVFTLQGSFLYHRIVHGDPFSAVYGRARPSTNPRIRFADYAADPRMVENVRALSATGIPYVLIHLPIYPELTARRYILTDQQKALRASLSSLTGRPFYGSLDYADLDSPDLYKFQFIAQDGAHPSLWGLKYHANAIAKLLEENGYLSRWR